MARTDPQLKIRLPTDLLQSVAADATDNKRSTTAEIVARLEASHETLRDRFAMAALTGLLASNDPDLEGMAAYPNVLATDAYAFADVMLAERQKGGA